MRHLITDYFSITAHLLLHHLLYCHEVQYHPRQSLTLKDSPAAKGKKDRMLSDVPHFPLTRELRITAFSVNLTVSCNPTSPSWTSSPSPRGEQDTVTIILHRRGQRVLETCTLFPTHNTVLGILEALFQFLAKKCSFLKINSNKQTATDSTHHSLVRHERRIYFPNKAKAAEYLL